MNEFIKVIICDRCYMKYTSDYSTSYEYTEDAKKLYIEKYKIDKYNLEFTDEDDDDKIRNNIIEELGSKKALKIMYENYKTSYDDFIIYYIPKIYKNYYNIEIKYNGEKIINIDYNKYKIDEITNLIKNNILDNTLYIYNNIKSIILKENIIPNHKFI